MVGDDAPRCEKNPGRKESLRLDAVPTGDGLKVASAFEIRAIGDCAVPDTAADGTSRATKKAAAAATAAAPAAAATRASSTDADT